jgi:hypothetical protein
MVMSRLLARVEDRAAECSARGDALLDGPEIGPMRTFGTKTSS